MNDSPQTAMNKEARSWNSTDGQSFVQLPDQPWSEPAEKVIATLNIDITNGLDEKKAKKRRHIFGANILRKHAERKLWQILLDQFKSLIIGMLAVAAVVAFIYEQTLEGFAIVAVILINAGIGFFTELRAVRSMQALYKLGRVHARVRRNGQTYEILADDLVPGDVVVLEGGDVITADLRIVESSKLQADESTLTGESVPVGKRVEPVTPDTPLAERSSMLYKGTAVTRGSGLGVVVATGMQTELGEISSLVEEAEEERTPLEVRLDKLGHKLIGVTLVIAFFIAMTGILAGRDFFLMIETGIALAVATIPEGLPIVATIALARGMQIMAHRNALINRLSSVETLGATNVIFTDKTGTLTQNKMTLTTILMEGMEVGIDSSGDRARFKKNSEIVDVDENELLKQILEVGVLCNNATLKDDDISQATGDPLEVALLMGGMQAGIDRKELVGKWPEVREEAFDPEVKMMATFHKLDDGMFRVAVKGAPEAVLHHCRTLKTESGEVELSDEEREKWLERNNQKAGEGLRMLAVAEKMVSDSSENPYQDLQFMGLVGLEDPPRTDVRSAIQRCQQAGVKVIMSTGDQPVTARNIAKEVGLVETQDVGALMGSELKSMENDINREKLLDVLVFARVSPAQKLDLIELYQKKGDIVAMTGDGVNDAPALKKADIGIAMGKRGTQVAREAADMVLQDDSFSSIVAAIEQGRVIFGNIRRFVYYLLSCNVSEVMTVGLASLAGIPLPILPLQILFLNLVTDIFPALALGVGKGEENVMQRPPRDPEEAILRRDHWQGIAIHGAFITIAVIGSMIIALEWLNMPRIQAVTISFLTLSLAQLWHVFNMHGAQSGWFVNEITQNKFVWGALILCILLVVLAIYVPGLSYVLQVVRPGALGWLLVIVMSLLPLFLGQIFLMVRKINF